MGETKRKKRTLGDVSAIGIETISNGSLGVHISYTDNMSAYFSIDRGNLDDQGMLDEMAKCVGLQMKGDDDGKE